MRKLFLVVLLGVALLGGVARADTRVELFTMGPGGDVFEAFGHGSLCVTDAAHPTGTCYNYGTADFRDPVALIWKFLRGGARFWVSRMPRQLMVQAYTEEDRTLYRQVLPLSADAAAGLAATLEADTRPERKYYLYNHYRDNCTTRLRDHLDAVTGGALRAGSDVATGQTWRDVTLQGFAQSLALLVGMEVLVGHPVDTPMTLWDAMFLPDVLRVEVGRRLGAPVEVMYRRRAPLDTDPPLAGRYLVLALAGGLTMLMALAALIGRSGLWRFALGATGAVLGSLGLLVYVVVVVVTMVELHRNEVMLVLLPTDLALLFLRGLPLRVYLFARVLLLGAVVIGLVVGLLVQPPMLAVVALAAGPLVVAAARELRQGQLPAA
jgi:hypothetical protein